MEESGIDTVSSSSSSSTTTRSLSVSVTERSVNSLPVNDGPPVDDCCPICFSSFVAPCRGPCGHWYCGACIIEYWNHVAQFRPCRCPMCSRPITKLTPETTLSQEEDAGIHEVLKNIRKYNSLFTGGVYGFVLKILQLPLYIRRLLQAMMDPDRPVAYLSRLRLVAVFLGTLYTLSPFDFLPTWRYLDPIDLFDCSAIVLSFTLYFVGLYSRRRRLRNLRQIPPVPHL